ncbi:MAG: hypothetical protein N4A33_06840 [Bacteriovoracaceae bacterium]|jgi:hypothetical protein|nr:hypothetical protein [Bacteriovoracaceae bacterium]
MYQFYKNIINFIGIIPFARYGLKYFYLLAIKKVKEFSQSEDSILDAILMSKLDHKNFIYGSSDLNILFIIKDHEHPKKILGEIREKLKKIWPINILVNLEELTLLKDSEAKTPLIRSYLVRKNFGNIVSWKSIISNKNFTFDLKTQDHFSIQYQYIRNIDKYIFEINSRVISTRHSLRSFAKNIYISIKGLKKYQLIKGSLSKEWNDTAYKTMRFSLFYRSNYERLRNLSAKQLNSITPTITPKKIDLDNYPENLVSFCQELLKIDYISDLVFTPALIQLDHAEMRGQVNIDIILCHKKTHMLNITHLNDLIIESKKKYQNDHLKAIFRITSIEINRLKDQYILGQYPLRGLYRSQQSISLMGSHFEYSRNPKFIKKAAIHYLLNQFMHFRSFEHKESLLGSKFIKSLNLIYRYKLLLDYLQGKEFAISHNYKSITCELTPQLSHLKAYDIVDENSWKIIRAQMLYLLKKIRDELSKTHSSIKNLQF